MSQNNVFESHRGTCYLQSCESSDKLDPSSIWVELQKVPGRLASPLELFTPIDQTADKATEKAFESFRQKHDVKMEKTADGKQEIYLDVGGQKKSLFTVGDTADGVMEADKKMETLIKSKQGELELRFKVAFSKDGENVGPQQILNDDCTFKDGTPVLARGPRLAELYGIEEALQRSRPSHLTADGKKGTNFIFLTDNAEKGDKHTLAYYTGVDEATGRPTILFEPHATFGKAITEKDTSDAKGNKRESIQALTQHEIGHNAQNNMNFDDDKVMDRYARMIGWEPFTNTKGERDYMFKGRNGELYRFDKDGCKEDPRWFRSDSQGRPLDKDLKPVANVKDALIIAPEDVQKDALVEPPTYYFPSPFEMFDDGIMVFRMDSTNRGDLLAKSPKLYDAVKLFDQAELNKYYGVEKNGTPRFIRTPDGFAVPNSPAQTRRVRDFEAAHRKAR